MVFKIHLADREMYDTIAASIMNTHLSMLTTIPSQRPSIQYCLNLDIGKIMLGLKENDTNYNVTIVLRDYNFVIQEFDLEREDSFIASKNLVNFTKAVFAFCIQHQTVPYQMRSGSSTSTFRVGGYTIALVGGTRIEYEYTGLHNFIDTHETIPLSLKEEEFDIHIKKFRDNLESERNEKWVLKQKQKTLMI